MVRTLRLALFVALPAVLVACGSSIGQPCADDTACDNGQTCYTALPDGFCSRGCGVEGEVRECPGGAVCARQGESLLCASTCQSQGDCREGYECNGLSGSNVKACRPKL